MSTRAVAYETIVLDVQDQVATVTLNRPERRNAYTWRMGAELSHAFEALDASDDVRAIVVTGAGKAFCVGFDLEAGGDSLGPASMDEARELDEALHGPHRPVWELGTPIIAAINGHAVGVGITLPLLWDIRIAAEDAKISFVFPRRGLVGEATSHWILPRTIGVAKAFELMVTGRIISGAEAAEIGLVSRAVPRDEVLAAAMDLAREIAVNCAPASVSITKKLIYRFLQETDRMAAQALEQEMLRWTGAQPDAHEGIMSFLEKRPPQWKLPKNDLPDDLR